MLSQKFNRVIPMALFALTLVAAAQKAEARDWDSWDSWDSWDASFSNQFANAEGNSFSFTADKATFSNLLDKLGAIPIVMDGSGGCGPLSKCFDDNKDRDAKKMSLLGAFKGNGFSQDQLGKVTDHFFFAENKDQAVIELQ